MKHTDVEFVFELLAHKSRFQIANISQENDEIFPRTMFLTTHTFLMNIVLKKIIYINVIVFNVKKRLKLIVLIITLGSVDRLIVS